MSHFMLKSKKAIVERIAKKFNFYIAQHKSKEVTIDRDKIYLSAFQDMITLQNYGLWPKEAEVSFNELTKLHLGKTIHEIEALSNSLAIQNVKTKKGLQVENVLSEEEYETVKEYHKFLFAITTKNENPFNKS